MATQDSLPRRRALLALAGVGSVALTGCIVVPAGHRGYPGPTSQAGQDPRYGDDDDEVDVAPPPPQSEVIVAAPGPGYFWIGGHWAWVGGRHVWMGGRWSPYRPGWRWAPFVWFRGRRGWRGRPGRWERG